MVCVTLKSLNLIVFAFANGYQRYLYLLFSRKSYEFRIFGSFRKNSFFCDKETDWSNFVILAGSPHKSWIESDWRVSFMVTNGISIYFFLGKDTNFRFSDLLGKIVFSVIKKPIGLILGICGFFRVQLISFSIETTMIWPVLTWKWIRNDR